MFTLNNRLYQSINLNLNHCKTIDRTLNRATKFITHIVNVYDMKSFHSEALMSKDYLEQVLKIYRIAESNRRRILKSDPRPSKY